MDDDASGASGPLPPDDRLWRHPSEVGATVAPRTAGAKRPAEGQARLWLVVVVASVTGAAAALGAMVVIAAMPTRVEHETTIIAGLGLDPGDHRRGSPSRSAASSATPRPRWPRSTWSPARQHRSGSAVILRSNGALITSRMLVESATTITVVLADGRTASGTVVGTDPSSGLAVIRIGLTGLPVAVTDTVTAEPGDRAVVLAGPVSAGEQPWVSLGVVSSVHRQGQDADGHLLSGMTETNSPVAAAADGGALVAADGKVSGV